MPPTLILIRHAEAEHNATHDYEIPDPHLTAKGRQQCLDLKEHLQRHLPIIDDVEAIVVSPMRRALETMQLALPFLLERGVEVTPDADWQENSDKPCDTGSPISVVQQEFPAVNLSGVDPRYPDKTSRCSNNSPNPYAWTRAGVLARAQRALAKLHARPEKVIAVVTHSGFLRLGISHTMYENADYRVFDFATPSPEGTGGDRVEYGLVGWEETRGEKGRGLAGGMGRSRKGPWISRPDEFPAEEEDESQEQVNGEAVEQKP